MTAPNYVKSYVLLTLPFRAHSKQLLDTMEKHSSTRDEICLFICLFNIECRYTNSSAREADRLLDAGER